MQNDILFILIYFLKYINQARNGKIHRVKMKYLSVYINRFEPRINGSSMFVLLKQIKLLNILSLYISFFILFDWLINQPATKFLADSSLKDNKILMVYIQCFVFFLCGGVIIILYLYKAIILSFFSSSSFSWKY